MKRTVPKERLAKCALCNKEMDLLTAPAVGIVGGSIFSFCSFDCKEEFFEKVLQGEGRWEKKSLEEKAPKDKTQEEKGLEDKSPAEKSPAEKSPREREPLVMEAEPILESEEMCEMQVAVLGGVSSSMAARKRFGSKDWELVGVAIGLLALLWLLGLAIKKDLMIPDSWSQKHASAEIAEENKKNRVDPELGGEVGSYSDSSKDLKADSGSMHSNGSMVNGGSPTSTAEDLRVRARKVLIESMKLEGSRVQIIAAEALIRCDDSELAWRVLRKASRDTLWTRRQMAAEARARLGDRRGLNLLEKDIRVHRGSVRRGAVFALGRLGETKKEPLKHLRRFLYRPGRELAAAEVYTVADKARESHAVRVLERILRSGDSAPWEKLRAAAALGLLGDPQGKEHLKNGLRGESVHLGAALALERLQDFGAVEALTKALDYSALRLKAAPALKRLGVPVDLKKLGSEMVTSSLTSRVTAAAAVMILTRGSVFEAELR